MGGSCFIADCRCGPHGRIGMSFVVWRQLDRRPFRAKVGWCDVRRVRRTKSLVYLPLLSRSRVCGRFQFRQLHARSVERIPATALGDW